MRSNHKTRYVLHIALAVVLIVLGILGKEALNSNKRPMETRSPSLQPPVAMVTRVCVGPHRVRIRGEGTVRPLREIELAPQVGGRVVGISSALVDGGDFRSGDLLLKIDPVDYELAVMLARARVKESESVLKITEEEAAAALEEWNLLYEEERRGAPPPLVAKEPQLLAAQARLEGDRADLRKSLLNLERTELRAPFDGRVSWKNADLGQYVISGQAVASLFSTEAAEIVISLDPEELHLIRVPGFTPAETPAPHAAVRARIAGEEQVWEGRVVRAEGKLDEKTRMIRVVVRVEAPYSRMPPLAAGLFVHVDIEGSALSEALVVPRSALRLGDTVWVVDPETERIHFRHVHVAHLEEDRAVIISGLEEGSLVVISTLETATEGMRVRYALAEPAS